MYTETLEFDEAEFDEAEFDEAEFDEAEFDEAFNPRAGRLFFETSPSTTISPPTLSRGSRGPAVRDLQQRLATKRFNPGTIDGIFGARTEETVRAFQTAQRIPADGFVGKATWSRLLGGTLAPPPIEPTANRWVLPPDVRAAGEAQSVRYDDAPAWKGPQSCPAKTLTPGARALGDYIKANFPGVSSIGGFCCRPNTANTSQISIHGTGRALDIMIPIIAGRADSNVGDPIANWLVTKAAAIGVQYIIWNRVRWAGGAKKPPKDGTYGGPVPHIDHIHAELNIDGGNKRTPWFQESTSDNVPSEVKSDPQRGDWTQVAPEARRRYVMNLLVTRYGYPINGAAGLVGNLWAESMLLPNCIEGGKERTPMRARDFQDRLTDFTAEQIRYRNTATKQGPKLPGVGLAQWSYPSRRKGLFDHRFGGVVLGTNILFDMDAQVDYAVAELRAQFRAAQTVLMAPSVTLQNASDEVVYSFERPKSVVNRPRTDPSVQAVFEVRRTYSQAALQAFR